MQNGFNHDVFVSLVTEFQQLRPMKTKELATLLGLSPGHLSNLLKGRRPATPVLIARLKTFVDQERSREKEGSYLCPELLELDRELVEMPEFQRSQYIQECKLLLKISKNREIVSLLERVPATKTQALKRLIKRFIHENSSTEQTDKADSAISTSTTGPTVLPDAHREIVVIPKDLSLPKKFRATASENQWRDLEADLASRDNVPFVHYICPFPNNTSNRKVWIVLYEDSILVAVVSQKNTSQEKAIKLRVLLGPSKTIQPLNPLPYSHVSAFFPKGSIRNHSIQCSELAIPLSNFFGQELWFPDFSQQPTIINANKNTSGNNADPFAQLFDYNLPGPLLDLVHSPQITDNQKATAAFYLRALRLQKVLGTGELRSLDQISWLAPNLTTSLSAT